MQNDFIESMTSITIFGISKEVFEETRANKHGDVYTFREYLIEGTGAINVERTSRSHDIGKYILLVKKSTKTRLGNGLMRS